LKIARFEHNEKEYYGIMKKQSITSIIKPKTIEEYVSSGFTLTDEIKRGAPYKLDQVKLLAPLVNPPKIICLGLNYRDHATEQDTKIPDEPVIFMKPRTAITGPNMPIIKPKFVRELDYEAELAIVMGKKAKNITARDAKHYIFGYTILNDISARDIQFKDKQWTRSKGFDTFAPTGPCITTTEQIPDPDNLTIKTWVNQKLRQNSTTKNMVFNAYEIVHHLSKVMTLEPCDIISTGTPAGVGVFMKPRPKFLKHGDRITVKIERIGKLENFVSEI
jgi:2-keto-4-pentenoate hydratase/2-oxohepta-3-ene-1,7-dioic acid hydratase in catechol pathway